MSEGILIKATPWDEAIFGMPTWEITEYTPAAIKHASTIKGHQTIRVDPLANKKLLHETGFYYCDTLLVPFCKKEKFSSSSTADATVSEEVDIDHALDLFRGSFTHGRFHRDFNLPAKVADTRYDIWLRQLFQANQVYGLYWKNDLAGFIGYDGNHLTLHAISEKYRGKGLAKYWWSIVCQNMLDKGHTEITSSISASNLPVVNLYISLGFSFKSCNDIYHRLV